jgi:peptide/nickel transport system ATP-binding protein
MGVIAETTNRVAVMKNGELVEIGKTKEILTHPKQPYTKSLVSSVPPTNKKISRFVILNQTEEVKKQSNLKILSRWTKREINQKNLVSVKNLFKTFDDNFFSENSKNSIMAVDDVSFSIKEGETFGLVGESGSGKSTIAKMIVNLYKPSSGDIYFDDVCITQIKKNKEMLKFRKQIQMIFQDPYSSLNGRLKVKDIVAEPILLHNPSIKRSDLENYIFDLLQSVELSQSSAERYPHEFSGGQRQRISIARALATQPRLLVCDEPTSALDVSIQAQILNLLKDLQEQLNLTILFISHDLPVVRQMCDRIGVLRNGKLCEVSNSEKLFEKPEHEYTKELLNLMPKIEAIYN